MWQEVFWLVLVLGYWLVRPTVDVLSGTNQKEKMDILNRTERLVYVKNRSSLMAYWFYGS